MLRDLLAVTDLLIVSFVCISGFSYGILASGTSKRRVNVI
jgi:hypothetical protein